VDLGFLMMRSFPDKKELRHGCGPAAEFVEPRLRRSRIATRKLYGVMNVSEVNRLNS
jgi:hypothetical protein